MSYGMSAIGPKQASLVAPHMSAFGGKADLTICRMHVRIYGRYWGQSGHHFLRCICLLDPGCVKTQKIEMLRE